MPTTKYTKKAGARKMAPRSRARTTRRAPSDSQTMLLTSYFEIENKQSAAGADGKLAYAIKCDPRNCSLTLGSAAVAPNTEGVSVVKGDGQPLVAAAATSGNIPFSRFAQFAPLYRQYRINSVKVDSMVDRECGLDNPVNFSTDKASSTPASNMSDIVGAAHKSIVMTESRRQAKYGWKPSDAQDKEFRNMSQELNDNDAHFIKCFQDIEAKADGKCKHRVTVTMSVTLKDSTGTAVALN